MRVRGSNTLNAPNGSLADPPEHSPLKTQLRRRNQNPELLAPDRHMAVGLEVDAVGDIEILAALEGAEAAEVDEHGLVDLGVYLVPLDTVTPDTQVEGH